MKKINSRWVKISGSKFNIDKKLEDDKDFTVAMFVSSYERSMVDNQDGTFDVVYKMKPTGELVIKDSTDKIYVKADKRSQSKKLRGQIFQEGRDYKDDMIGIRYLYNPYIIELLEKKKRGEL